MDKKRDFTEANRIGEKESAELPKVTKLNLEKQTRRLVFDLTNGVTLIVPADSLQGLKDASETDLMNVELWDDGLMIYWTNLDVAFQIASLLLGVFGTKRWISEINKNAGSRTSRQNGEITRKVA